jgi:type I restriction enzyme R subunit
VGSEKPEKFHHRLEAYATTYAVNSKPQLNPHRCRLAIKWTRLPPFNFSYLVEGIAMNEDAIFRRRNLPHIDIADKPYFITACLHGSINAKGLKQIRAYRDELASRKRPEKHCESEWESVQHKLVFKLVDSILDGEPSVQHLRDDRLAAIVQKAFLHFADQRYQLFAFVVMPSHHHWVFLPDEKWSEQLTFKERMKERPRTAREAISHSIQSYTGSCCNKVLGVPGQFWQWETFDHYVRNENELMRIIHYIEQNPIVAGLASKPGDFRWSSAFLRKKNGLKLGDSIPKVA